MPLRILNSVTKQKEVFKPLREGEVGLYVCGPTVYDEPHIGHLRSAYAFEVIRNYLKYSGHKVRFVRNVTDVDDKIIDKARQEGYTDLNEGVRRVSEKYFDLYKRDLKALGIQDPDAEPRATGSIARMIELTQTLISRGAAYAAGGDVYFDVNKFGAYGMLSHQNRDAMLQNVRVEPNEQKKNPLDFALWKSAKEGEPSWDSPWGKGRPGWHIECSAMSMRELGETFDIHGGGRDLIFPHHENEIAQSCAATGKPFARYWIHHGLITVNEQKMSKSLKNFITLTQLREEREFFEPDELKLLFLGTHYSAPLDYSDAKMEMEKAVWKRFYNLFYDYWKIKVGDAEAVPSADLTDECEAKFGDAMDDNFNTPAVLSVMHDMIHRARKSEENLLAAGERLLAWGNIFLIFSRFRTDSFSDTRGSAGDLKKGQDQLDALLNAREAAKREKRYSEADAIRKEIEALGYEVIDSKEGQKLRAKLS